MNPPSNNLKETPQRILVVDDEGIVLVALREILLREGYHVLTHSNPLEALESLKRETFSVILTDQQMPILTGLEFLSQAKLLQPDATRILITAVLSLDMVIDAINKGEIYRFIVKPWLREELLATVKSAVSRYEQICRNQILQASALSMNLQLAQLNAKLEQQVSRVAEQNHELERLNKELQGDLTNTVQFCPLMLDTFYPLLGYQARRTRELCHAMGQELKLSSEQRNILEAASLTANVGLIGIPRTTIRKHIEAPNTLTQEEHRLIRQHPVASQNLLVKHQHLRIVSDAVRGHHERYDGRGFPDALKGDQIPHLSALLAVATACAGLPDQNRSGLHQITSASGKAFHPDAVKALQSVYSDILNSRKPLETPLSQLQPGMILAKDVCTDSGKLLLPKGRQLTETNIGDLQNRKQKDTLALLLQVTF